MQSIFILSMFETPLHVYMRMNGFTRNLITDFQQNRGTVRDTNCVTSPLFRGVYERLSAEGLVELSLSQEKTVRQSVISTVINRTMIPAAFHEGAFWSLFFHTAIMQSLILSYHSATLIHFNRF